MNKVSEQQMNITYKLQSKKYKRNHSEKAMEIPAVLASLVYRQSINSIFCKTLPMDQTCMDFYKTFYQYGTQHKQL